MHNHVTIVPMETLISQNGRIDRNQRKHKKWRKREKRLLEQLQECSDENKESIVKLLNETRRRLAQLRGVRKRRPTREKIDVDPKEAFIEYVMPFVEDADRIRRADELWEKDEESKPNDSDEDSEYMPIYQYTTGYRLLLSSTLN